VAEIRYPNFVTARHEEAELTVGEIETGLTPRIEHYPLLPHPHSIRHPIACDLHLNFDRFQLTRVVLRSLAIKRATLADIFGLEVLLVELENGVVFRVRVIHEPADLARA